MNARDDLLDGIRTALGPAPPCPSIPRAYRRGEDGRTWGEDLAELFCRRAGEFTAKVVRSELSELESTLAAVCAARGSARVAVASGVQWNIPGVETWIDRSSDDPAELDDVDGALTGCTLAIAETGTIVLDGGPECGRRALTLVPDHHICVVRSEQIVNGVPEAISMLSDAAREGRPLTFVSGPSATSDIELERVEGVHGPRRLDLIVCSTKRSTSPDSLPRRNQKVS